MCRFCEAIAIHTIVGNTLTSIINSLQGPDCHLMQTAVTWMNTHKVWTQLGVQLNANSEL